MFTQLLERIALGLEERQIPYMVIGGQAVLIYGEPRLTRDIDVTLGVGPERLKELLAFAKSAAWRVLVETPEEFVQRTMVLPLVEPESGIRIDLVFSHSVYEQQAMQRVQPVDIGKAAVRFASAEDVIVHKIVAGRPRDREDVRSILLKNSALDEEYVRYWLAEFDRSLGEDFTARFNDLVNSL
jgi:predicted nucleotidyltransferase